MLSIKRVYDPPSGGDGLRVLVDRIWPRGMSRDEARIDLWVRDVAPSAELRKWFGHDPDKWPQFKSRYFHELERNAAAVEALKEHIRGRRATLVYGAKDTQHNNAVALQDYLSRAA